MSYAIRCEQAANAYLGEGPVWHVEDRLLYWLDVARPAIFAHAPGQGQVGIWPLPSETGCMVPRKGGGVVVASRNEGIVAVDPKTGRLRPIAQPAIGRPPGRANDGRVDPKGRLWVGWLTDSRLMPGAVFRIDPDGSVHTMIEDVVASNGMGWSPDGLSFYHTDSHIGTIWAYAFEPESGTLGARRPLLQLDVQHETPDGMQVDANGDIWAAVYRGGRLIRLDPAGRIREEIPFPTALTTSCAFGGDDLATLFVTTAIRGQSAIQLRNQPLAGSLFAFESGVRGQPDTPFAG